MIFVPHNYKRDVHGILLVDKHQGPSSNTILQDVKKIYYANKAGHTGTLDPIATGMLPICFGEATKFAQYLLNAKKNYHVVARLGENTTTADSYGSIIQKRPITFTQVHLNGALEKFRGDFLQTPPMFSAVKYHGKQLYKYAKKGINIQRKPRLITVHNLHLIEWRNEELELEICCSKGTYIRTIIDSLGEILGCGAHVIKLHRLQVGHYPVNSMVSLCHLHQIIQSAIKQNISPLKLLDLLLLPIDSTLIELPIINLSSDTASRFKKGQTVKVKNFLYEGIVKVTEGKDNIFIGIALFNNFYLAPHRLVSQSIVVK
ncbi:tRNA pseudouridine(55) synthase TruB [Candidatus Ishikawella capsulata]|uniref:tRNA pseudouridine synthase B n=1 Tax=Candidatus Ishikawaella capsulata Mpkobe TaxID=476281 RepID=C5WCU3_9ENTR|nr:tRNA pseudouridine(55) synthase TruB [Candidatus Ishikawaella capsulata]BAH83149.1 tRNA pseudouridine synthase B [Candidatus Ishikawaella capsulata Mpkobe]